PPRRRARRSPLRAARGARGSGAGRRRGDRMRPRRAVPRSPPAHREGAAARSAHPPADDRAALRGDGAQRAAERPPRRPAHVGRRQAPPEDPRAEAMTDRKHARALPRRQLVRTAAAGAAAASPLPALAGRTAAGAGAAASGTPAPASPWDQLPAILARIVPPRFPARDFDLARYGAVGDGSTDCTTAFRDAIAACSAAGGGRVVVPAGRFLTGPIHLRSNV